MSSEQIYVHRPDSFNACVCFTVLQVFFCPNLAALEEGRDFSSSCFELRSAIV